MDGVGRVGLGSPTSGVLVAVKELYKSGTPDAFAGPHACWATDFTPILWSTWPCSLNAGPPPHGLLTFPPIHVSLGQRLLGFWKVPTWLPHVLAGPWQFGPHFARPQFLSLRLCNAGTRPPAPGIQPAAEKLRLTGQRHICMELQ